MLLPLVPCANAGMCLPRIRRRLIASDRRLADAADIYVVVQNRQAFLYGRVRSEEQKQHATTPARDIEGIGRVTNRLVIGPHGWRVQDDSRIENAIEDELYWSPFVVSDRVDVVVANGVATLSGTVDSFGASLMAVAHAFEGGAKAVRNRLQITCGPVGG